MSIYTYTHQFTVDGSTAGFPIHIFGSKPFDILGVVVSSGGAADDELQIQFSCRQTSTQPAGSSFTPKPLDPDAPASGLTLRVQNLLNVGIPTLSKTFDQGFIDFRGGLYQWQAVGDEMWSIPSGSGFGLWVQMSGWTGDTPDVDMTFTIIWQERGAAQSDALFRVDIQASGSSADHWSLKYDAAGDRVELVAWGVLPELFAVAGATQVVGGWLCKGDVGTLGGDRSNVELNPYETITVTNKIGSSGLEPIFAGYIEQNYFPPTEPFWRVYPPGRRPVVEATTDGFAIYIDHNGGNVTVRTVMILKAVGWRS